MEQQSITVAKSGVICSLPARISILAAANPIGGQYDKSKTLPENLHISQPILSRFDLIFLLLDKPNKVNIYRTHRGKIKIFLIISKNAFLLFDC